MQSERAALDQLTKVPYLRVLTYPRISLRSAKSRVRQLEKLGVEEIIFSGRAKIGRLGILGIGTVGVVVRSQVGERTFALKIRRTDANRPDMDEETRITRLANRLGIGPFVRGNSKDFLLMDLLEYTEIDDWVRTTKGPGQRDTIRNVIHELLNQCRTLDIMGIDHGQLSNLRKHAVIAQGRPWIIDFESAGIGRRPKNVTAAAQHLLVGSRTAILIRRALGIRDTKPIIAALSEYKREESDYSYSRLLEATKIVLPRSRTRA